MRKSQGTIPCREIEGAPGPVDEAATREKYRRLTLRLIEAGRTITAMESCTGGQVISLITDTEGASAVMTGAFITYSNAAGSPGGGGRGPRQPGGLGRGYRSWCHRHLRQRRPRQRGQRAGRGLFRHRRPGRALRMALRGAPPALEACL